jgi:hypothetical protein
MVLAPVTIMVWAATAVATAAVITVALSTLVPLLVLAAGFEAVLALHLNVERIGRYLQIFHEETGGWEHVVREFGRRFPKPSGDPLFSRMFTLAISANFLPAALGGTPTELAVVGALHLLMAYRVFMGRRRAVVQPAQDLERFRTLRG